MTMKKQEENMTVTGRSDVRKPYAKPEIKRVELALEETMSSGCKLNGSECTEPFPGISEAGS
jgi:hypothetical protein